MDIQTEPHIKGLEEAGRMCRPVRSHGPRRVRIGGAELIFRPAVCDDPVPTRLQILELVDARPSEEYMVLEFPATDIMILPPCTCPDSPPPTLPRSGSSLLSLTHERIRPLSLIFPGL